MGKSFETKKRLFSALKQSTEKIPLENVSVQEITDACSLSRRSFYYHFNDMLELIKWGWRSDLAAHLKKICPEKTLVYPASWMKDPNRKLPYYARSTAGIRSLDCSAFFTTFYTYLDDNKAFYRAISRSSIAPDFLNYVKSLYHPVFFSDIKFMAGGRPIPREVVSGLAERFTYMAIISCFTQTDQSELLLANSMSKGLENFNHDFLYLVVKRYFDSNEAPYKPISI